MRLTCLLLILSLWTLGGCTEPNPAYSGPGSDDSGLWEDGQPFWPDGPGPGPDFGQPPDWSGPVCTPSAFVGCSSPYHMQICNPTGTGSITVSCAPYLCNQGAKRCNQCDPGRPPKCVGNAVHSCSKDGLIVATTCPDGCDEGKCDSPCTKKIFFKDDDNDGYGDPKQKIEACTKPGGYVEKDGDCNDADWYANPGQLGWFYWPMKGWSASNPMAYDFNCDGTITMKLPQKYSGCALKNSQCQGSGWNYYVPECSKLGWWIECTKTSSGRTPCKASSSQKVQSCH